MNIWFVIELCVIKFEILKDLFRYVIRNIFFPLLPNREEMFIPSRLNEENDLL